MCITFPYGLPGINSPPNEFSSLFRYGQQVNSKKLEILPLLLFKTAKSAEPLDTTRIQKRDAILEIQYSGGTLTSTCLVSKWKLGGLIWRRDKLCKYRSWATYKQRNRQLLYTCSSLWFLLITLVSLIKGGWWRVINWHYYSFKIFPRFLLAKRTGIILHNQLLMTKFGRILRLMNQWRPKCSFLVG